MGMIIEDSSTEILVILAVVIYACYRYFVRNFDVFHSMGVPYVKPMPLFGNAYSCLIGKEHLGETVMTHYNLKEFKDAPFFGFYYGTVPFIIIRDFGFLKEAYVKNFSHFADRDPSTNLKNDPINDHLSNAGGWKWRVLRSNLSPLFTSGKLKWMFDSLVLCAKNLEKYIEKHNNDIVELKGLANKFSSDAITSTIVGIETNALLEENNTLSNHALALFKSNKIFTLKFAIYHLSPTLFEKLGLRFIPKELSDDFFKIVNDAVEYRTKNNIVRNDLIHLLMELQQQGPLEEKEDYKTAMDVQKNEKGHQVFELTNNQMAAQVFIFFMAGLETSATTASFTLYELGCNPDMQERLSNEINEVIEKHGNGPITYAALQEMIYLDMVVMETLRHYPPTPSFYRRVTFPYKVPGTKIIFPAKLRLLTPVYAIHHDPKHYPDPYKFDPERFSPENKKQQNQAPFLAFGLGPRNCIGGRLGMLQVKLFIATFIRKFRVSPCEKTTIPARMDPHTFLLSMKGQIYFRVTSR